MLRNEKNNWLKETKGMSEVEYYQHAVKKINTMIEDTEGMIDSILDKSDISDEDRLTLKDLSEALTVLAEIKKEGIQILKDVL
jgi:hypothetical protein